MSEPKNETFTVEQAAQEIVDYLWETELINAIDYFAENKSLENHVFRYLFFLNTNFADKKKVTWEQSCKDCDDFISIQDLI